MSNRPRLHVHLFTNDLSTDILGRMHELTQADYFLGLYMLDEMTFGEVSKLGFRRMSRLRYAWLRESLRELQIALRRMGADLKVSGDTRSCLQDLAERYTLSITVMDEPAHDEQQRLMKLRQAFGNRLRTLRFGFLLETGQVASLSKEKFPSFTPFRYAVEKEINQFDVPKRVTVLPPAPNDVGAEAIKSSKLRDVYFPTISFQPGCLSAQLKLNQYLADELPLGLYKKTRNGLLGAGYSTGFSVYLANGALTIQNIWKAIDDYETQFGANEGSYWLRVELLWREFFRLQGEWQQSNLFRLGGYAQPVIPLSSKQDVNLFHKWSYGQTGQPFIDACMNELRATGYLSNRGRQNAASYLIHDLGIDWRWGAWWFQHCLIDFDVYSNQGNWQYIAGVGCDPKGGRIFEVEQQASWYDAKGEYLNFWLDNANN